MVYNIEELERLHYRFTTNGGSIYEIIFIPLLNENSIPIYAFNIERVVRMRESDAYRNNVRDTVVAILKSFFDHVDEAILSTCDTEDGKQDGRKRLFDRWLREMNDGSIIMKDALIEDEGYRTWASLYYHKNNMFKSILEDYFHEFYE